MEAINQPREIILTGRLKEFKDALNEEIKAIEKNGQSSTMLRSGRRIEKRSEKYWYRFHAEYIPVMPADTPCNLYINKKKYTVTVIGVDESEITIESDTDLGESIGIAKLDNGSTVLMERLISRIEKNSDRENQAGNRMLPEKGAEYATFHCIEPDLEVEIDKKSTKGQNNAVFSALKNDITYIWGPPGTGKTFVIGSIIKQLYKANRTVLIVSHTNTAVDGAIENVQDMRNEDGSCPVLRIGIPQKKLDDEVLMEEHIKRFGATLFKRREELWTQRQEKISLLADSNLVLTKFNWFKNNKIDQIELYCQEYYEVNEKNERAQRDYEITIKEMEQYRDSHPEIQTYKELQRNLASAEIELNQYEAQITEIRRQIDDKNKCIGIYKKELEKCDHCAEVEKELKSSLPISVLRAKLEEQKKILRALNDKYSECESNIAIQKQSLSKMKRNGVSAFLSKKSIQQAELRLVEIYSEIEKIELEKGIAIKRQKDAENIIKRIELLEKEYISSYSGKSKQYWEENLIKAKQEIKTLQDKIQLARANRDCYKNEIASIRKHISDVSPSCIGYNKLRIRKEELANQVSALKEKLQTQKETIDSLLLAESNACRAFSDDLSSFSTYNQIIERLRSLKEEIEAIYSPSEEEELYQIVETTKKELEEIKSELEQIEEKINDLEKQVILNAKIVGATLVKSYLSDILQEAPFDTVIVDEASMASIPALWCVSYIARRNIVIVGDFLQLPPIVMAKTAMAKRWLEPDIFFVTGMQEKAKKGNKKPDNFIMLNEQFRMEKGIADIANIYYGEYEGLKSNDMSPDREEKRKEFEKWYGRKQSKCVQIIDTHELHAWATSVPRGKSHSYLNCFSAALVVRFAFGLLRNVIESYDKSEKSELKPKILIVAPYRAHIERIQQLIEFENRQRGLPEDIALIKAGTIHSFQGSEADIVIFDVVVDEPLWNSDLFYSKEDNYGKDKLFNVAVTRAKFKLFVVGNIKYCRQRAKNNSLSKLLDKLIDEE